MQRVIIGQRIAPQVVGRKKVMHPGFPTERRNFRRYIVEGTVTLSVGGQQVTADLVNFGFGGLLMRSPLSIPAGTHLRAHVLAHCYPNPFEVPIQVVGGKHPLISAKFLERPTGAHELLLWVEQEHFPWTGTLLPFAANEPDRQERKQPVAAAVPEAEKELEEVYQLA
jgi:hypothetical protein